jgi:surface polysaccharide O-acyltransferase-like enzyme
MEDKPSLVEIKTPTTRIAWVDTARVFAIFCVVLCHAVETVYQFDIDFISRLTMKSRVFMFVCFTISRLGVPFFLFITGFLLLDRIYTPEQSMIFWKKNWIRLLITVEIWTVLYALFLWIFQEQPFNWINVVKQLTFIKSVPLSHMWYIPMIIGMYIFIPLVANMLHLTDARVLIFPLVIVFILSFLYPSINVYNKIMGHESIKTVLSIEFSGGIYGFYLISGYLVRKNRLKRLSTMLCLVLAILSIGITVVIQLYSYRYGIAYNVWYDFAFLMIAALLLFEMFSRFRTIPVKNIFYLLSKYAFAVYLIHNPIIILFAPMIEKIKPLPFQLIILTVLVFTVSWMISFLLDKIPKIGKWLLYIR